MEDIEMNNDEYKVISEFYCAGKHMITVRSEKKTRQGLADKEVGDQLIIDVDRYKAHPDCERLICFVYDPEGRIGNPNGIMGDLNTQHEGFATVYIYPNI